MLKQSKTTVKNDFVSKPVGQKTAISPNKVHPNSEQPSQPVLSHNTYNDDLAEALEWKRLSVQIGQSEQLPSASRA